MIERAPRLRGYGIVRLVQEVWAIPGRVKLPPGYNLSLLGVLIFTVGGVLDMIWHILFGIEVSVEALLSPTHLILAFGLVLIVSGPFRAAWLRLPSELAYNWVQLLPAILSLTLILSVFEGFTQYAHPQVSPWAAANFSQGSANVPYDVYVMNADGSLQSRLISDASNHIVPAWSHNGRQFVFASDTNGGNSQIYVANADGSDVTRLTNTRFDEWAPAWSPDDRKIVFTSDPDGHAALYVMNNQYPFVLSALVAGLIADLLVWRLKPAKTRLAALRIFALVIPIVYYSLYFLVLLFTKGIGWSIHLWMGSIVLAGIIGLLLSYLLVPLPAGMKETKADVTNEG